jgi:hypothetical protein
MLEGLWTIQYHGPQGIGGGVIVLDGSHIRGGDNGYTYVGTYHVENDILKASVLVSNFDSSIPNVLGIPGDFRLLVEGKIVGDEIKAAGWLADMPDSRIVVTLTKKHETSAG